MAVLEATSYRLRNGEALLIRTLRAEDAASFLAFRAQVPHDSTHTMQYVGMTLPTLEETSPQLTRQSEDPVGLMLGAFAGERVVGNLSLRVGWDHPWIRHLGQFGMMILKGYWGLGLGARLLQLQEEHALRNGLTRIEALVRVQNERGLSLYLKHGFEIEGTRRQAALIDGEYRDEYFIAKIFG